MKFRAVFRDPEVLYDVCDNARKIQKYTLLKLSASKIRLSATTAYMEGGSHSVIEDKVRMWVSISSDVLFSSVHVESKRKNEIFCLMKTADITIALRQANTADTHPLRSPQWRGRQLCVKLAKDGNQPILQFSSSSDDQNGPEAPCGVPNASIGTITHSVPVQVIGDEGPDLAQLPSITECVRSFVLPPSEVLYAFCSSCQLTDDSIQSSAESTLPSSSQQVGTIVMKIEIADPLTSTECQVTFFCSQESASLRCVFEHVQLLPSRSVDGEAGSRGHSPTENPLYYTMKPNRLCAVMRALCREKRPLHTQSIFHCTENSGIICSTKLAGDSAGLYHIPCIPTAR
ncbi:hypothetical protein XU18_2400 [Perkinsela sp. CCAP 1560/4]|nr:hypothetical protein XU18_2400 [Perkinsela sp. CCAP 1560/4]|eukprot:KNH06798.1 hypothetical protein XU18_2400 [Perkinsela sp. CCAP 1560/4]